jgi:hypothetical protein
MSGAPDSPAGNDVTVLESLDRDMLIVAWRRTIKTLPPKGIGRRLMVQILSYETQVQQRGWLKPAVRRRLARWAAGRAQAPSPLCALALAWSGSGTASAT